MSGETEIVTSDVVLERLTKAIIDGMEITDIHVSEDHDTFDEPHGYNPAGGAASHKFTEHLICADSVVSCWAMIPFGLLPGGYHMRQESLRDRGFPVHGAQLLDNLFLRGPGIDDDDPEPLADALEAEGESLLKVLVPAIREEINDDDIEDFDELAEHFEIDSIGRFAVGFNGRGVWMEFKVWVEEKQ